MEEKIRKDLQEYVSTISANNREMMEETARLACFLEDLLKYKELYDTSLEGMDDRYARLGEGWLLKEDGNLFINVASGAVPVDDRLKKELRLYENAKPRLKDAFDKLRYCDEMWFFTTDTVGHGLGGIRLHRRQSARGNGFDLDTRFQAGPAGLV